MAPTRPVKAAALSVGNGQAFGCPVVPLTLSAYWFSERTYSSDQPCVENEDGEFALCAYSKGVFWPLWLQPRNLTLQVVVQNQDSHAELFLQLLANVFNPLPALLVFVDKQHLGTAYFQAVKQRITRQIVVDPCWRTSYAPAAQVSEQKLGSVHHVHGKELSGHDAMLVEVLAIATGIRVGFGPGVASVARPDTFFIRG